MLLPGNHSAGGTNLTSNERQSAPHGGRQQFLCKSRSLMGASWFAANLPLLARAAKVSAAQVEIECIAVVAEM
jgi:hypothetical protein